MVGVDTTSVTTVALWWSIYFIEILKDIPLSLITEIESHVNLIGFYTQLNLLPSMLFISKQLFQNFIDDRKYLKFICSLICSFSKKEVEIFIF